MHITLSNIRAMEGTKGGWFVVTIIFYKQSYLSTRELDLKHFNYLWVIESCFL